MFVLKREREWKKKRKKKNFFPQFHNIRTNPRNRLKVGFNTKFFNESISDIFTPAGNKYWHEGHFPAKNLNCFHTHQSPATVSVPPHEVARGWLDRGLLRFWFICWLYILRANLGNYLTKRESMTNKNKAPIFPTPTLARGAGERSWRRTSVHFEIAQQLLVGAPRAVFGTTL